ncbi:MAG: VacB/RNase II family 3'-5' exoribonuclease [Cellvibrionaceae bacterium]
MLNSDALSALGQLKQSIEDSKDYGEGIVRGTNNRFGFVNLDDGREAFLNPDEMQQVLPGDRVKVLVTENDRKKLDAKLEKLISSSLKECVGRYVIKGKNHFVQADHPQLSRWLFVPPKERKKYQDGDYVNCKVSRHPFGDGKAQVSIIQLIGKPSDAGIERSVIIGKFKLPTEVSDEVKKQVAEITDLGQEENTKNYIDLREKNFVTIDAASTKDMDDALYAEINEDQKGWALFVAIADPSVYIDENSPLDKNAENKASSAYLLGGTLSMFPTELSHDIFSLVSGKDRPALVCKMQITIDGSISSFEFFNAIIQSKHKLSYLQVSEILNDKQENELDSDSVERLHTLNTIAASRKRYRDQHSIIQQDNIDYSYQLDKQGHIESIEIRTPTNAHHIVEEAMLATNCCAGEFLSDNSEKVNPLFTTHAGFRPERLNEIKQLLKKDFPEISYDDLAELNGYIGLIKTLKGSDEGQSLVPTLRRLLRPAELTSENNPHFGLGFKHYAMVTSPIRRYQDLTNHRIIKSIINSQNPHSNNESTQKKMDVNPKKLQDKIALIRQASRQLEQWLLCEYLNNHKNSEFTAKIAAISNQGLAVRLKENGAESFIPMKNTKSKPAKYDSIRMTLTYEGETYRVDQELTVKLSQIDLANRKISLAIMKNNEKNIDQGTC